MRSKKRLQVRDAIANVVFDADRRLHAAEGDRYRFQLLALLRGFDFGYPASVPPDAPRRARTRMRARPMLRASAGSTYLKGDRRCMAAREREPYSRGHAERHTDSYPAVAVLGADGLLDQHRLVCHRRMPPWSVIS